MEGSPRLTSLTRLSLANRMIVGLATLAIIVFGVLATLNLKQELLPSIQVPTAIRHGELLGRLAADRRRRCVDTAGTRVQRRIRRHQGPVDLNNGSATITVEWEYGLDPDKVVADIRTPSTGSRRRCRIRWRRRSLPEAPTTSRSYCWPSHPMHLWRKPAVRSRTWRSRSCQGSTAYAVSPSPGRTYSTSGDAATP